MASACAYDKNCGKLIKSDPRASVFQGLILWPVASQFLFAIYLVPTSCSALTALQDVTRSISRCLSPGVSSFRIPSGVEQSWHI